MGKRISSHFKKATSKKCQPSIEDFDFLNKGVSTPTKWTFDQFLKKENNDQHNYINTAYRNLIRTELKENGAVSAEASKHIKDCNIIKQRFIGSL